MTGKVPIEQPFGALAGGTMLPVETGCVDELGADDHNNGDHGGDLDDHRSPSRSRASRPRFHAVVQIANGDGHGLLL